ncbi:hypothetical protein DXT99_23400 [Pontibacter diazotrophicus]|uniref:Uncharacterized protein n=1 Tax=Pontibacter diazotrophicus TaxID=1400979 RepID=A0A3D8L369_9BACT|nr:hypothetical protein DXT99_23400 [Pontibacter diazotrophicus]
MLDALLLPMQPRNTETYPAVAPGLQTETKHKSCRTTQLGTLLIMQRFSPVADRQAFYPDRQLTDNQPQPAKNRQEAVQGMAKATHGSCCAFKF